MKIYVIWLTDVIIWNFGFPNAPPPYCRCNCCDSIIIYEYGFKKMVKTLVNWKKNKYFENKK